MAKIKILKTSTEVMVVLNVKKDVMEALDKQPEYVFVQRNAEGKETYRLAYGTPCVKPYGVAINGVSNLVEHVKAPESVINGVVKELKFKYADVEAKVSAIEKELLVSYEQLKEKAEKVEVEEC